MSKQKKRIALGAEDLKPGLRFKYGRFYGGPSVTVEILRGPESTTDTRFGLPRKVWWSKNLDTGEEGYGPILGPGGMLYVDEILGPYTKPRAKRTSPRQLEREIAESLSKSPRR